jgi:hypothetical protein
MGRLPLLKGDGEGFLALSTAGEPGAGSGGKKKAAVGGRVWEVKAVVGGLGWGKVKRGSGLRGGAPAPSFYY